MKRVLLPLLLLVAIGVAGTPAASAAPSAPVKFTFYVLPLGATGITDAVATIVTTETFHIHEVLSVGTWLTYAGFFSPGGVNPIISAGQLTARHSPAGVVAEVTQVQGPTGHGKLSVDAIAGEGTLGYIAGGVRGTVRFRTIPPTPPAPNTLVILLQDPVPPIFFGG